jgi:hypothetical protein
MTLRIPRGYGLSGQDLLEISKGERPALQGLRPSKYLPIKRIDEAMDGDGIVLEAGQIVALGDGIDVSSYVPANGGTAQTLTYTSFDIGKTKDLDNPTAFVSASGTTTAQIPANKPVGWLPMKLYNANLEELYTNYSIQPHANILCDYFIEMAVKDVNDANGVLANGDLLKSDANGNFVKWIGHTDLVAGDDVDQVCGRVLLRSSITADAGLALVSTVPGLNLPGSGTAGLPRHLNVEKSTGVPATDKVLIQITLL